MPGTNKKRDTMSRADDGALWPKFFVPDFPERHPVGKRSRLSSGNR
jgi:hypothetical protein